MKKFCYLSIFTIMLFFLRPNTVKADTRPFSDWVSSYGYAGERVIASGSNGCIGVVANDQSVVSIYYNNSVMCFTTDPKSNAIFKGPYDQFPFNGGYIDRSWNNTVSTLNLGSLYAPFNGVNLSSVFDLSGDTVWWTGFYTDTPSINNADVSYTDLQSFIDEMEENDWENPNDPDRISGLPLLNFTVTNKSSYSPPLNFDTKEIITWNFAEQSIYANNPTNYALEIVASARVEAQDHLGVHFQDKTDMRLDDAHKVVLSNGGCLISQNSFSFLLNQTGQNVYKTYNVNWVTRNQNVGFNLYLRIKDLSNNETSAWKIYTFNGVGNCTPYGYAQDDDQLKPLKPSQEDAFNPDGGWSDNSQTSSQSDPTSDQFNGKSSYDVGTVISTLKSIVNSLQDIPSILTQLLGFMPEWLTSLIILSIALLVVIGVTKTILG